MPGLSNKYIQNLGELMCGKNFAGVYPCDIQPQFNKRVHKFSVIFNTDKHNESGSHFVAIFCNKNKLFYFDPFGKKCTNKYIKKFIVKHLKDRKCFYNATPIQNIKSLFCGLFCLSFIISENKQIPFKKYLFSFSKNNKLNDSIVTEMIIKSI